MAVEAERLISMSMGKIHASRSQRGGINLHKNLLVATVLHKARTVYMMESYNSMMRARKSDSEGTEEPSVSQLMDTTTPSVQASEQPHVTPDSTHAAGAEEAQNGDVEQPAQDNKENSPPARESCRETSQSSKQTGEVSESSMELGEQNCGRCAKRRLTEIADSSNVQNTSVAPAPSKKAKLDSGEYQSVGYQDQQCQTDAPVPNTTQITNLVHSFSSGFTGLLSGSLTAVPSPQQCDLEEGEDSVFSDSQSSHSSDTGLISCSTQIKEAFETLARPIIALTV